jgi:hypothetical protein
MTNDTGNDNILFQVQIAARDWETEKLQNANFAYWAGTDPLNWSTVEAGSSLVSEETTDLRPGTVDGSACKFIYDASHSGARISQTPTLIKDAWYYVKIWYKYENEVANEYQKVRLRDSGSNVYLDSAGNWAEVATDIILPVCTVWTYIEIRFQTHTDYSDYNFGIGKNATINSAYCLVDDIEFRLDTSFYALKTASYNGAQYLGNLKSQGINITKALAYRGDFEESRLKLEILDPDGSLGDIIADFDTGKIIGANMIAREKDGTIIQQYRLTNYEIGIGFVAYHFSDGYSELRNNFIPPKITEEEFSDVPEDSVGHCIPYFSGQWQVAAGAEGLKDYIAANRTKDRVASTTDGRYLLGLSVQDVSSIQYVIAPDGTDLTASCTLVTPTAADPYHYIELADTVADEEYLKVHFVYPTITPETMIEEIGDLFFTDYPFNLTNITGKLGQSGRHYEYDAGGSGDRKDCHFLADSEMTRLEILEQICKTYNMSYHINVDRKIAFEIFDPMNIYDSEHTTELNEDIATAFIPKAVKNSYDDMTNQVIASWSHDSDASLRKLNNYNNFESQARYRTVRNEKIECPHFPANLSFSRRMAQITAKLRMIEKFNGEKYITFEVSPLSQPIDNIDGTLIDIAVPFEIWKFKHIVFEDTGFHYLQVRRVNMGFPGDSALIDFVDVTHTKDLDIEASLLIQSNDIDGGFRLYDKTANGFNYLRNVSKSVKHDTDYPLFGKSSIGPAGSTPDLQSGFFGNLSNLHIFDDIGSFDIMSVTLAVWVRFNNTGTAEAIVSQYDSATEYWRLWKKTDDKIELSVVSGGGAVQTMTSTSTVADGKWHHILYHRDYADNAGLYVNGKQEDYDSSSMAYSYASHYSFKNNGNSAQYMDGNIQSLYINGREGLYIAARAGGWFELAPVVGLTDEFDVPWGLMSIYYQKYWVDR